MDILELKMFGQTITSTYFRQLGEHSLQIKTNNLLYVVYLKKEQVKESNIFFRDAHHQDEKVFITHSPSTESSLKSHQAGWKSFFERLSSTKHFYKFKKIVLHPRKLTWIPKMTPYLKGDTLKKPSFLVSMLDFGGGTSSPR